jgi:hypothetical protein
LKSKLPVVLAHGFRFRANCGDAAANLRRRIAALNERRHTAGQPVTDTHLALHVGELLYGNLDSPRRLDFTVLGSAVNEAARIGRCAVRSTRPSSCRVPLPTRRGRAEYRAAHDNGGGKACIPEKDCRQRASKDRAQGDLHDRGEDASGDAGV